MKPVLDDQSAITYTSVVILVLTFFIYLVANQSPNSVNETRIDGFYKSFGWKTPREKIIANTAQKFQRAFADPSSEQINVAMDGDISIPLEKLFPNEQSEIRADALAALQIVVDTLRSSALTAEFVVQQAPGRSAPPGEIRTIAMQRAAAIIRYFNDSKLPPGQVAVSSRSAAGPWNQALRVRFRPTAERYQPSVSEPSGNRDGMTYDS